MSINNVNVNQGVAPKPGVQQQVQVTAQPAAGQPAGPGVAGDANQAVGQDAGALVGGMADFDFQANAGNPTINTAVGGPTINTNVTGPTINTHVGGPTINTFVPPPPGVNLPIPPIFVRPTPPSEKPPVVVCQVPEGVEGRKFQSKGDPHETTGDGLKFDNSKKGTFTKLRSKGGDFVVQTTHAALGKGVYNLSTAIRMGSDVVGFSAKGSALTINGQSVPFEPGKTIELAGGGTVMMTASGLSLKSPAGDVVNVDNIKGKYLNLAGELSPQRQANEVRGSLGNFDADNDKKNDLLGADGQFYKKGQVKKFIETWRTKPEDNLTLDPTVSGAGTVVEPGQAGPAAKRGRAKAVKRAPKARKPKGAAKIKTIQPKQPKIVTVANA